jgi:threonine dehydrogenase-like Zn-dependent dehydrogenase
VIVHVFMVLISGVWNNMRSIITGRYWIDAGVRGEDREHLPHVFPRCVAMLSSGAIDVKPLITRTFEFDESVRAFEIAASAPKGDVKMQIAMPQ